MLEALTYLSCGQFISRGEWMHPRRIVDSYEVLFVTQGTVHLNENGEGYVLQPGTAMLLEPNVLHYGTRPSRNVRFFWLHIDFMPPGLWTKKTMAVENTTPCFCCFVSCYITV